MKVGINLPSQFPFGSTAQMLEVDEQVGFESYWSPDHILGVFHPELWSEIPLSDLDADGLEHIVLANITGVVGGMDEIMARGMELPMLKHVLSEL